MAAGILGAVAGAQTIHAARRHPPRTSEPARARLESRPLIDVDLHMHTDHSHDCATPVEALLAAADAQLYLAKRTRNAVRAPALPAG